MSRKTSIGGRPTGTYVILLLLAAFVIAVLWWQSHQRRPTPGPTPTGAIRIATWNLRMFGNERRADLGAIAKIITEGQFDLVAVQEVRGTGEKVDALLNVLGAPWRGTSFSPKTGSNAERFVFLYRGDRVREEGQPHLLDLPEKSAFDRVPYIAGFRSGNFDFELMSVHLSWSDATKRHGEVQALVKAAGEIVAGGKEKDLIVLGDFNEERRRPNLELFQQAGWQLTIKDTTNLKSRETYDNLVLDMRHTHEWTGRSGAVAFDETMFANKDAEAVEAVSDHRPAWAEFDTSQPDDD